MAETKLRPAQIKDLVIDAIEDVDTTTTPPTRDQVLKWNGTAWIPAAYNATFAMTIATFADDQTDTQLIGSGVWKATGAIAFTASYNNPPPSSASIALSSDGGVSWASALSLSTPFTSGVSAQDTNYPSAKDKYITFTLTAMDGATARTSTATVTFRNYRFWGTLNKKSGITETDVETLSSELSNLPTGSKSINSTSGMYLIWAYPSTYTSLHATGALFNSVVCPFETVATVSITNSAGYTENYKVYASSAANLGNSTLSLSTSSQLINRLYYGKTSATSGFSEADVEGLANSTVSNDNTQTWSSVTVGAGEYLLFAFPTRLGIPSFYVGGFEGGFQSPETVSITNVNGYAENYYVWRSTNSNLGATIVSTQ